MNRAEKKVELESLKRCFAKSQLTILADYKGLTVAEVTDLRQKLREKQSLFKVVKNRLAKIAVKDLPASALQDHFCGTTAVATTEEDPVGPAKVLVEFSKDNERLKIKVGVLAGQLVDVKGIQALARLPGKNELIAKLMGSVQAPLRNLVFVLSAVPRQLVTVLSAVKEQKEKGASEN